MTLLQVNTVLQLLLALAPRPLAEVQIPDKDFAHHSSYNRGGMGPKGQFPIF